MLLLSSFVKSKEVFAIINTANQYHVRPSDVLALDDEYTALCLDEACMYIQMKVNDGDKPQFEKHYKSFRDMYKDL